MSLEDLEKKLYGEKEENREQFEKTEIQQKEYSEVQHEWGVENTANNSESKSRLTRNVVIVGIAIIALSAFVGGVLFLSRLSISKDVNIEIYAPQETSRGIPFEIAINAVNQLDSSLRDAVIELKLPQGLLLLAGNNDKKRAITSESIGTIKGGDLVKRTYKIVPVASENTIQKITVSVIYTGERGGRFEATETKEINISKSAITVEIKKPDYVFKGSSAEISISYKNISDSDIPEAVLQVQYPPSFKFVSASAEPDSFDNHWNIGTLRAGKEGKLTIRGTFGSGQDSLVFPVSISGVFLGSEYKLVEQNTSVAPAPAPVALEIFANGSSDYVARLGDIIQYTIRYENMSGVALADVVIKATIAGNMIDMGSINTKGNVNTLSGIVTWNASNIPDLKLIDPGAYGEISISVRLKSVFPSGSTAGKNYAVRVDASFDSPSVPYYLQTPRTTAVASIETRVGGGLLLDAQALHYDVLSGIPNDGAFPPKVGKPTQYTIHWILRNFSTDSSNINVIATLGPNVKWTGVTKSEPGSSLSYNERTQEVSWIIAKIPAMRGVTSEPVEAIFQIEATPDATDVAKYQTLLNQTTARARDDFTGNELVAHDSILTTNLTDDRSVGGNAGIVVP